MLWQNERREERQVQDGCLQAHAGTAWPRAVGSMTMTISNLTSPVRLRTIVSQELAKSLDYIADKHLRGRGEEDWKTYHR
jgi:hypothetical protein